MRTQADLLKERTFGFAESIVKLVRVLPATFEARRIGGQLFDAGTSVAANYRAACKAWTHAESVEKSALSLKNPTNQSFGSNFLYQSIVPTETVKSHRAEASELTAIFTASHKTASSHKRART